MKAVLRFISNWMLPLAIVTGISAYLVFHFTPALYPAGPFLHVLVSKGQPILISVMLFLQFAKVSPRDLKVHRWHFKLLFLQGILFIALALAASQMAPGTARILTECAMLCFICPTAAAAGVITDRLGGSMAEIMSSVVMINCLASLLIPAMIPLVHPSESFSFWSNFLKIITRVFSILLLPCVLAWTIRFTLPALQEKLEKYAFLAFYIWGIGLTFAVILATRALLLSHISAGTALLIALTSLLCCLVQFGWGRKIARSYGPSESLTSGQAFGQKNTGFLIWLGYTFLTPVTSVAGGFYSIWHNMVNSWELYLRQKEQEKLTSSR